MKTQQLTVRKRQTRGKGGARQVRAGGNIPAIFYGEKTTPTALELNAHEFTGILKKSTSEHILVDLAVEGEDGRKDMALVKEVQHDPITEDILHVDFLHIHPSQSIRVTIPVRLTGIADGVKNFGGILQHIMRDVEAEGLPADLPDLFEVDVTALNIHDAIHVSSLTAEGVTIITPSERTIASVVPPTVVKEVETGEEVEGEEPAEGEEGAVDAAEGSAEKKPDEKEGEKK